MYELFLSMKIPLLILQAVVSPVLIGLILLQSGKGDDLGSALGGAGGGNTVLGTGGTSKVLVRGTVVFAIVFMINSIALAKIFKEESLGSIGGSVSEPVVPADVDLDGVLPEGEEMPSEAPAETPTEQAPEESTQP